MNEVFRQEKKYWMTQVDLQRLSARLDSVMRQDPHNGAQGYIIRSLYFDTLWDTDYYDKIDGVDLRRKIRLRVYDPAASFAMLEMKQKEGNYQKKRSLRLERSDAQMLSQGNYDPLLQYPDPFAAECYGLLHRQCYQPKTIVEYRRKAYIVQENKIRITLDQEIRATESNWDLFSPQLSLYPVMDPFNGLLEVKYNGFLLSYIKALVSGMDRAELSVSKYCLARRASMQNCL